jgi:hypothetical protein
MKQEIDRLRVVGIADTWGEIVEVPGVYGGMVRVAKFQLVSNHSILATFTEDAKYEGVPVAREDLLLGDPALSAGATLAQEMRASGAWKVGQYPRSPGELVDGELGQAWVKPDPQQLALDAREESPAVHFSELTIKALLDDFGWEAAGVDSAFKTFEGVSAPGVGDPEVPVYTRNVYAGYGQDAPRNRYITAFMDDDSVLFDIDGRDRDPAAVARELNDRVEVQIAKDVLEAQLQRRFVEPDLQQGRYSGLVLGQTDRHLLLSVDGRDQTATVIEKSRLGNLAYHLNQPLDVQFREGRAQGVDKAKALAHHKSLRRAVG